MKRLILPFCLVLALTAGNVGAQLTGYTNTGVVNTSVPLVIDATNVVNLGTFNINYGSRLGPFAFSDVQTYTNRNLMESTTGFIFNNSPAGFGIIGPSVNFVNQNPGEILGSGGSAPQIIISATNITNSGTLLVSETGEISASGDSLDLNHGTVFVQGLSQNPLGIPAGGGPLGPGIFDQYWGIGLDSNNFFVPVNLVLTNGPTTAGSTITNLAYTVISNFSFTVFSTSNGMSVPPSAIALTNVVSPSNIITQVIIYGDSVGLVNLEAHFAPVTTAISTNNFQQAVVKWGVLVTNVTGQAISNALFLTDDLGSLPTNTEVVNNTTLGGLSLFVPTNFTLLRSYRGSTSGFSTGNVPYSTSLFNNGFGTNGNGIGSITNIYATFEATLAPVTAQPDSTVGGSTFSNVPGRVEISAGHSLNLALATIDAGNYLNLYSPNDYRGSQGALITFPFADINLGSSNGQMTISNLVPPYVPQFTGSIQAWSCAWTNLTSGTNIVMSTNGTMTNTFAITNAFTVLMVASSLQPTSPVNVENLALRSTNLAICDVLAANESMVVNAQNLTITSNAPGALSPVGELIYDPADESDLYSANFPSMLNFTNFGLVETLNAAFFQVRQNPGFPLAGDGPWQSIVNHNEIVSVEGGLNFWANYFENSAPSPSGQAVIESLTGNGFGPVFVQSSTALLSNSAVLANSGDMSFTSGNLTVDNTTLSASGFLDLAATNLLTDLTPQGILPITPVNTLACGDGFSLVTAPSSLSGLLGSSVTSACRATAVCKNYWFGTPTTLAGGPGSVLPTMANNVPIGQLIFDGGDSNSVFHFQGADPVNPYAMYVDQIELQDGATNFAGGKYTAFNLDPNFTIYYLKASIGGNSIAAALNGTAAAGGGHLVWLSNYVSHFSVTQVTYADGETFNVNSSYVQAYGLPPEPPIVLTPQSILLKISTTNVNSTPMANISWYAPAKSTNTLYYRTLTNPSWQVRTNFVAGSGNGRVSCLDSLGTGRMYKVSVGQ